jgi:nucleolar GTP-binding protein
LCSTRTHTHASPRSRSLLTLLQSITALAHLRAACAYLVDISEQCGYTIAQQAALFHSIKPLFANKPILIVCNKIDSRK